jgi:hypothetical protein
MSAQLNDGNYAEFNEIKSRKLIVVMEVEDPQTLKDIESDKDIADHAAAIAPPGAGILATINNRIRTGGVGATRAIVPAGASSAARAVDRIITLTLNSN